MRHATPTRLVPFALSLALAGCQRTGPGADAGAADGAVDTGAADSGAEDTSVDSPPPPALPPCDDPGLWSASPDRTNQHMPQRACNYDQLEFPLASRSARAGWATEVCWRVIDAGPETGYRSGETWWSGDVEGEPLPRSTALRIRSLEEPLVIAARFVDPDTHELREVVTRFEAEAPLSEALGVVDFHGFGQGQTKTVRGWETADHVQGSELVDRGERVSLPGRVLATGSWRYRSAILVEEDDQRWLLVSPWMAGEPLERVALDVSTGTRFLMAPRPTLVDRGRGEVVFLDAETLEVRDRLGLPEGTSEVVVTPAADAMDVYARVGAAVYRSRARDGFTQLTGLPPILRMVPQTGDPGGRAHPVLLSEAGLHFLEGGAFGEPRPLPADLSGELLGLSGRVIVTTDGFAFASYYALRGPLFYDTRARLGGPISHLSLDAAAYAVARPDGTHDLFRTPYRCSGE